MASNEDNNIRKTFSVLSAAKTDNEKFAALLLFAKTTNAKDLSLDERRDALDAIGASFFHRLLKSKNIPEDCPATVFKGLALKILSGLCGDRQLILDFEVYKNLRSINDTITDIDSEDDMIIDCFDILTSLTQTEEGSIKLVDYGSITALSEVITKQLRGCDKGQGVLRSVLHFCGEYAWKKDAPSMHMILEHFCKQFDTFQDETKFELCAVVSSIISCLPKEMDKKSLQRSWFISLNHALNDIFTSKLGQPQRDPALRLASSVLDKLGVDCILPPHREDCKLLLIIIHLSCIEIRITLENLSPEQMTLKTDTLVSCYNLLELIICHMTSAPSLKLDENQVLQLHSAMEGAFNSVIFFLREQSEQGDQVEDPNQILLASVRVLGSWLAEETSALKIKVQEILPFIVKLCKSQMECLQKTKLSKKKKKVVKFECEDKIDKKQKNLLSKLENCSISKETNDSCQSVSQIVNEDQLDCHSEISSENNVKNDSCDSHCHSDNTSAEDISKHNLEEPCDCPLSGANVNQSEDLSQNENTNCANQRTTNSDITGKDLSENLTDKTVSSVLNTSEISIRNVDLIGFLLPGLCHMTAEDASRKILLDNDVQSCLSAYFSHCVDTIVQGDMEEAILTSMETLCGVFLNLVVLEPKLISESEDFHKVTFHIFQCAGVLSLKEDMLTLSANVITLGVFFLRQQPHIKYDEDDLIKFFSTVVTFIKAPYTSSVINNLDVLSVSEIYLPVWDSIYQLWYLCIQATTTCLPVYPSLVFAMMSSGFLPYIIKLLNKVQGRNVDEDTLLCLIGVITSLATTEPKASDVLKSCGGVEFSKLYNCSELDKLIR